VCHHARMVNPWDTAKALQAEYWRAAPEEQAMLAAKFPHGLSWRETFRLHHLVCCDRFLGSGDETLLRPLVERLLSEESPYRPRHGCLWQQSSPENDYDLAGSLLNASLTHLGALEVLRLTPTHEPIAVDFLAFDDIWDLAMNRSQFFRPARVLLENGSEEVVAVPMLYGLSWASESSMDQDGRMTRFERHFVTGMQQIPDLGIGLGQQDLTVSKDGREKALLGLGSVQRLQFALNLADRSFDEKARGRGLDPAKIRASMIGKN
jgi:hypothetical protein